jgi:phosphoesterase RecJ-like protein
MGLNLDKIIPVLREKQTFVLTTHVNPDGDGIGSEIALADWLARQGKSVHILNHSATPEMYLFLDPDGQVKQFTPSRDAPTLAGADVIVVLDSNHPERLRSMQTPVLGSGAVKVCIDHHLDPALFAHHYVIDDDATSTGEIVYRLLVALGGDRLSPRAATALYCAIMTDTGSFRYPRTDPEIHRIVAHLIECGADPIAIYEHVYEQWSPGRIQLLGEMLSGLQTAYANKLAHVTITQAMLQKTGTTEEDTDNFTSFPMSVEGVVIGILFLELKDGLKISFRSKGEIPINELARQFGGNGHKNAAGARLQGRSLDSLRDQVIRAAAAFVNH